MIISSSFVSLEIHTGEFNQTKQRLSQMEEQHQALSHKLAEQQRGHDETLAQQAKLADNIRATQSIKQTADQEQNEVHAQSMGKRADIASKALAASLVNQKITVIQNQIAQQTTESHRRETLPLHRNNRPLTQQINRR